MATIKFSARGLHFPIAATAAAKAENDYNKNAVLSSLWLGDQRADLAGFLIILKIIVHGCPRAVCIG